MGGRCYTVEFNNQTITAADTDMDLWELDPAAEKPIELYGLVIVSFTEVAEAQEEWLRLQVITGNQTSGSTPDVSPTPRIVGAATGQAAGFTAECFNATLAAAGAGSPVNKHSDAFNVRAGYTFWWPEGSEPGCSGADLLVVRCATTVADDVTLNGTAYVREYG